MEHLNGGGPGLAMLLLCLAQRLTGEVHDYSHVLSCQPGSPSRLLDAMFDDEELFRFDFQNQSTVARLPEFQKWDKYPFDPAEIAKESELCHLFLRNLTKGLTNTTPEARGDPVANVFTRYPLEYGRPNTLICFISNFFPPTLNITWMRRSDPVTSGYKTTDYYPTLDLGFYTFSYLNFTPTSNDQYTCVVRHGSEIYTTTKTWVPKNPIPSDLLENVLCGVAFCVGIICLIAGIVLLVWGRKPHQTD